jgi:hypothetical protein
MWAMAGGLPMSVEVGGHHGCFGVRGAVPNPLSKWGAKMNKNVPFKIITPTTDTIH